MDEDIAGIYQRLDNSFTRLWVELAARQEYLDLEQSKTTALYQIVDHMFELVESLVGEKRKNEMLAIIQYSIGKSIRSFDDISTKETHSA